MPYEVIKEVEVIVKEIHNQEVIKEVLVEAPTPEPKIIEKEVIIYVDRQVEA